MEIVESNDDFQRLSRSSSELNVRSSWGIEWAKEEMHIKLSYAQEFFKIEYAKASKDYNPNPYI